MIIVVVVMLMGKINTCLLGGEIRNACWPRSTNSLLLFLYPIVLLLSIIIKKQHNLQHKTYLQ